MKPRVNTDRFFNSHSKRPRGRGRWIFAKSTDPENMSDWYFSGNVLYSVAKKEAQKVFEGEIEILALS